MSGSQDLLAESRVSRQYHFQITTHDFDYPAGIFAAGWVVLDKTLALKHPALASPSFVRHSRRRGRRLRAHSTRSSTMLILRSKQRSKAVVCEILVRPVAAAPCSRGVRHSTARFVLLVSLRPCPATTPCAQVGTDISLSSLWLNNGATRNPMRRASNESRSLSRRAFPNGLLLHYALLTLCTC